MLEKLIALLGGIGLTGIAAYFVNRIDPDNPDKKSFGEQIFGSYESDTGSSTIFGGMGNDTLQDGGGVKIYDRPPLNPKHTKGVDAVLVDIMQQARRESPIDFNASDGLRTLEEQKKLKAEGKSQTLNSKHLTGRAIDIVALNPNGSANWNFSAYKTINDVVQRIAKKKTNRIITWGGSWRTFKDGPHFEISPKETS